MNLRLKTQETICALSTPPGHGALHVIRVSGNKALCVTRKLCPFLPSFPESHRIYYGWMRDSHGKQKLDEVLVSYFKRGKSFTGEESLEISCHGSPQISQDILKALIYAGARLAERGEFTYRAFMNGRIDLIQAENVLALVESRSQRAKNLALSQLEGGLSRLIRKISKELTSVQAHLEAQIDFSEENLEVASLSFLRQKVKKLFFSLNQLLNSFKRAQREKEGFSLVLTGPPNAGKSSLFNAILEKDQSIVTDQAGTTRDLIEKEHQVKGLIVRLVDSAGLRSTEEKLEALGVKKAREALQRADMIFYILDLSRRWKETDFVPLFNLLDEKTVSSASLFFIGNKLDLRPEWEEGNSFKKQFDLDFKNFLNEHKGGFFKKALKEKTFFHERAFLTVSAKEKIHLDSLEDLMVNKGLEDLGETSFLLTHVRQYDQILRAYGHLKSALKLMAEQESLELIAFEIQEALYSLHEVLGEEWNEQVMDQVFKEFCLGK